MSDIGGRVRAMIGRAILTLIDDTRGVQTVQAQLLEGETQDEVERIQNYGLTSVPHADAEAVMVHVGGLRSHGIIIAVDDRRYRLKGLSAGEVALYDDLGQKIYLKRDGIVIESDLKVTVKAPETVIISDTATITADTVNLGGVGGAKVARVGDQVQGGVIMTGSSKVKAA